VIVRQTVTHWRSIRHEKPGAAVAHTNGVDMASFAVYSNKIQSDWYKFKSGTPKEKEDPKVILFYDKPWDWGDLPKGRKQFDQCRINNCLFTADRAMFNSSHAVLFRNTQPGAIPPPKQPNQVWILNLAEAPLQFVDTFAAWKSVINWTMTYRRDSDIPVYYGLFGVRNHGDQGGQGKNSVGVAVKIAQIAGGIGGIRTPKPHVDNMAVTVSRTDRNVAAKDRLLAWFTSNCKTDGKREDYVKRLRDTVEVDIYGTCGSGLWSCKRKVWNENDKCYSILNDRYFFYLSFESVLSRDYLTEKVYFPMFHNVVPIVRGGSNYRLFLPPHSYIDTNEFHTPAHLASYLKKLSQNTTAYISYLEWKQHYYVHGSTFDLALCEICARLHNPHSYRKLYHDIQQFVSWGWAPHRLPADLH
jgi:alpha-1,3-fucosyltransferase